MVYNILILSFFRPGLVWQAYEVISRDHFKISGRHIKSYPKRRGGRQIQTSRPAWLRQPQVGHPGLPLDFEVPSSPELF